ncbi:MAG: DUF2007 domain-containing protein [Ruminococcaceae bacterium]|nr:DUF2007 domain-containing protein [Oscillospiraceae bacterium]
MDRFFGLDHASNQGEGAVLLTTVHDDVEKNLLCGILEEEEIPYLLKDRGSGEVVRILSGYSVFGSDIYVPAPLFEKASELLDAYRNSEPVEDDFFMDEDGEEEDA